MEYRFRKISLHKHIILSFVVLITLMICVISVFIHCIFKSELNKYIDNSNKSEVEYLIQDVRNMYSLRGWDENSLKILSQDAIRSGMALEILDNENKVIWSVFEEDEIISNEILDRINENIQYSDNGGYNKLKEFRFGVYTEDSKLIGYAKITHFKSIYYIKGEMAFLRIIDKILILITIVSLFSVVAISMFISRSISNPIDETSKMAKDIGEGKLKSMLVCDSSIQEIDELIYSINKLSMELNNQEILRTRLTTDIAHELRTPITSVQGHLDAIIDGIWEPTTERLMSIREEITRLSYLIGELRKLSKYESEKNKLAMKNINMKDLIRNISLNFESEALLKNIKIDYELLEIWSKIDKNQISQAIINILSNAIKYTNNDGKIYIRLYEDYNYVYISIRDTGIGIPQNDVKNIFERFYRVDKSRNTETGGIGVGLTIARSIVRQHNGDIIVKSELGIGTEFIIKIKR